MSSLVNVELEARAIGLLFLAGQFSARVEVADLLERSSLRPEHFSDPHLRQTFVAISTLLAQGRAPTSSAVAAVLGAFLPSTSWLAELIEPVIGQDSDSLLTVAERLRALAAYREYDAFHAEQRRRIARQDVAVGDLHRDTQAFLAKATSAVDTTVHGGADAIALAAKRDAKKKGGPKEILETGIRELDRVVGGLRQTLTVIGGAPGVGKSSIVATMVGNWLARGIRVGFFGLEDGTEWLTHRLTAREAGVELDQVTADDVPPDVDERIQDALGRVHEWTRNLISIAPVERLRPSRVVDLAREWVCRSGARAIVVDHLGELDHGSTRERFDLSIGESLHRLRTLAREYRAHVLVVAHFKRLPETSKPKAPTMFDFAESSYIERMARLALGVWPSDDERAINVTVLKNTFGRWPQTVELERLGTCALVANGSAYR